MTIVTLDEESQLMAPRCNLKLCILGGLALHTDELAAAPTTAPEAQRLLALLALRDRPVSRSAVAGTLWPDATNQHAHASLRSALSRLRAPVREAIVITTTDLALSPAVSVDLRDARALARRLLDKCATPSAADLSPDAIQTLSVDCLPDWYEDWAIVESEEWRQLRLHALDALSLRLSAAGRFSDAIAAALAALRAEPLRESACAALIRIHLAEGNQSEAIRTFERFRRILARELHIEPTPALRALLEGF
ncbi:MAG: SARP family transcriptional regulator [Dehalococcoidia bacterium]|nr:MAG: SARP family transcriptional regulator [Dehalococcoidia bacterium]